MLRALSLADLAFLGGPLQPDGGAVALKSYGLQLLSAADAAVTIPSPAAPGDLFVLLCFDGEDNLQNQFQFAWGSNVGSFFVDWGSGAHHAACRSKVLDGTEGSTLAVANRAALDGTTPLARNRIYIAMIFENASACEGFTGTGQVSTSSSLVLPNVTSTVDDCLLTCVSWTIGVDASALAVSSPWAEVDRWVNSGSFPPSGTNGFRLDTLAQPTAGVTTGPTLSGHVTCRYGGALFAVKP